MINKLLNSIILSAPDGLRTAENTSDSVIFEPLNFVENLSYMASGMLGIFVVIGIIITITYFLNFVSKK